MNYQNLLRILGLNINKILIRDSPYGSRFLENVDKILHTHILFSILITKNSESLSQSREENILLASRIF